MSPIALTLMLVLAQLATPDVVVNAPLKGTPQTPATMVVEPAAMMIATFDADGDGLVRRSEIEEGVQRSFAAFDPQGTGKLRYIAFSDWALRWLGNRAALPSPFEVDRNSDDQVSLDELQNQFSRLFARYDVDKDGAISRAELVTYRTAPLGANGPAAVPSPPRAAEQRSRRRR